MTHFKKYLDLFVSKGRGLWVNDADQMCIMLDEDYKRTFRAYLRPYPSPSYVIVNENGNPLRFRSAEAAAKHLLTDTN
jgi:hypothetical protein